MSFKKIFKGTEATKLLLIAILVAFVFYPFFQMVLNITAEDVREVFSSKTFPVAVRNTIKIALLTTLISVTIGTLLAFSVRRTNIRFKSILAILLILPMLIPSISHGMGLITLFGTNGIIRNLFGFEKTIYGVVGVVTGSVLYSYPVVFLMMDDMLKYQDGSPYEAAMVLGIPRWRSFFVVTMSYLKRPLIAAVFTVFTLVATDYGVPLMIGSKTTTLAVMMYQEVLGQLAFGKGSVVGLILLIPAILNFIINKIVKGKGKSSFVTKSVDNRRNVIRDVLAYVFCSLVLASIVILLGSFALIAFTKQYPADLTITFANVRKMLALRGDKFLRNSFVIAIFVSGIGVVTAFLTAYMTTRVPSKLSGFLHIFSITSLAIPGIVLGLSYAMTFGGSFIYGTLAIIILANVMHFFASPYQMMYNSLSKMNANLEGVGLTLGIKRVRIILDVIIPQCKSTIFEMIAYFFVNSMMTISAVSFLANATTKPLSLLISQFEGQMLYECAAVVSLVILISNVAIKGIVYLINRKIVKNQKKNSANTEVVG